MMGWIRTSVSMALLLVGMSAAPSRGADADITAPRVRIAFEKLAQFQIFGAKPQIVDDPTFGKVLKTNQVDTSIGWDMNKAKMSWQQGTISFWIQPVDWSGQPRFRQWLFNRTPSTGQAYNLLVNQFPTEKEEVLQTQFLDLAGTKPHLWNHFSRWENGKWYCITVTWRKDRLSMYLNGELDPIGHGTFGFTDNFKLDAEVFKDSILYLGTTAGFQKYDKPESSLMSAVEIRDVCLSPEDVRKLFYAQKPADTGDAESDGPAVAQVDFPLPPAPRLVVPADAVAPTIDGAVNDEEWSDAAVMFGMNDGNKGVLTDKPYVAFIKSDGKQLYFAIRSKVPSMEFLIHDYTERDSNTPLDDSWELFFYPDLQTQDFYQIVVNSVGAIFDWRAKNVAWNGNWKIEQRLASPNVWDVEGSIPLEELGVAGNLDGRQCRLGLYVNQKAVENRNFTWAPLMGLFEQPQRMGVLTFKKNANVVAIESLGHPTAGMFSPALRWARKGTSVAVTVTDAGGKETRKIVDTPAQAVHFDPLKGNGVGLLTIVSPPDASPESAEFYYSTRVAYDSIPVTVKLTNYPSREEAALELNYGALSHPEAIRSYRIRFGGGEAKVIERHSDIPWERIAVSTRGLRPGPQTCMIELLDGANSPRLTKEVAYTKEGLEPWRHNKIGIDPGFVPPPYTPMKVQGNGVGVIGRTIELAESGLPKQYISAGDDLLAESVKIAGELDGQKSELAATAPFHFTQTAADDSVGQAQVTLGPLSGSLKQTISFDGLCWYEIALSGKAKAQDVALEITLPASVARNFWLTDADVSALGMHEWETADVLKKDLFLPFTPHVYLGNDKMGLAWMAESQNGWQIANERKAIEIRRRGDVVVLKINLIDAPIELDGLSFAFGLQPTPVKPVSPWQQRFSFASGRSPGWHKDILAYGVYIGQDPTDAAKVVSYAGLPEPQNPQLSKKLASELGEQGFALAPYGEITWLSLGLPEMQTFGGDWYLNQPWAGTANSAANSEPFGLCDIENRDYQDFIVWRFINCWDGYGGKAVYFDLFSPMQDKLPEHNRGYTTRTGKTAYPYPILGTRAIARRLYIGYKQKNPKFGVFTHASNMYTAMIAFSDAWLIGEQFGLAASRYPEVLPYERYRAALYGYPVGVKTMFLPSLKTSSLVEKTELTSYLTGLVFNHNNSFWVCFVSQPILLPYLNVYNGGLWSLQQFLPYWEHPNLTNLDPSKFKVSGWYNAGENKGLLMVASLSASEVKTPVSIGKGWTYSTSATLKNAIAASEFGAWEPPATFDGANAVFKPYGVLMLEVQ